MKISSEINNTVSIKDIKFLSNIYPRGKASSTTIKEYADALLAGNIFPPVILIKELEIEEQNKRITYQNVLLDGYHRWRAHGQLVEEGHLQFESITYVYHEIPEGVTPRLYALSLSAKHGLRVTGAEKRDVARTQYKAQPGTPIKLIAEYCGVSEPTAKDYIKDLLAQFEETKRSIIMRLDMLGWTQQEIADKLDDLYPDAKGTSSRSIDRTTSEVKDFTFGVKSQLQTGLPIEEVSRRNNLPPILSHAIQNQDVEDQEKMKNLAISIQPYDVWNFTNSSDLFGGDYPGRIPGQLIAHVLYFYTNSGDVIIDPMVGSGTTLDVALSMGRKAYGFDIENRYNRSDIMTHNLLKDGWHERTQKANLIFWDPPYFSKMDDRNVAGGYSEESISKLSQEEYVTFFSKSFKELYQIVNKGTLLAFLMSDWDNGKEDGIFLWDYAKSLQEVGWSLIRQIQTPLSTQQAHPDIVNKFREQKRLSRLERYLLIARK